MKAVRRHELEQNLLADWIAAKSAAWRPLVRPIVWALAALVVAWVAWMIYDRSKQSRVNESWNRFLSATIDPGVDEKQAFANVAGEFRDTPAAMLANMHLGITKIAQANNEQLSARGPANEKLKEGINHLRSAAQLAKNPLARQSISFQIGRALESQGLLEDAKKEYEGLVKSATAESAFAKAAQTRIDDLNKPTTQQFYAWYATARAESVLPLPAKTSPDAKPIDVMPSFPLSKPSSDADLFGLPGPKSPDDKTPPKQEPPKAETPKAEPPKSDGTNIDGAKTDGAKPDAPALNPPAKPADAGKIDAGKPAEKK